MEQYDLIVIGAGPGGYVAAIRAAKAGLSVAVIEDRRVGGTCLNRGCIPAKAMIHASSLYREMTQGERFGLCAREVSYDYEGILAYKKECIDGLVGGVEQLLRANGVTVYEGRGRIDPPLDGKNTVSVSREGDLGQELKLAAEKVILATGSKPARIPVPGMDLPRVLDSDGLFALEEAPDSLLIIGGGVIGVEFATVFSNLGTEVTIVEALPRLLDNFDREISQNLKMILKKRGVEAHLNASVLECLPAEDDGVRCVFEEKGKRQELTAEYVLVAAGRRPVTDGLFGTEVEMKGPFVAVDDHFRTSMPGVYAIGDLTGGIQLAHAASAQGAAVVEEICGREASQNITLIPAGVYTDPEIAQVGLTEARAKEEGIEVRVGKFIMSANGKSLITKEERGFIKVLAHASTDRILGAQMMCARATDMIGEFTTAIANGLTSEDMLAAVRPHPTYNEGIGEALEELHGGSVHTVPRRKR